MKNYGLILRPPALRSNRFGATTTPTKFVAPRRIDNSTYLTGIFDQKQTPECAGFSMKEDLEASYWRQFGVIKSFNADDVYSKAKTLDGNPRGEGTDLESVILAAEQLYGCKIQEFRVESAEDVPYAIHRHGIVMCGLRVGDNWSELHPDGSIGDKFSNLSGHAVNCTTYDESQNFLLGPNHWGSTWGIKGFWKMTKEQFIMSFVYGYGLDIIWPE